MQNEENTLKNQANPEKPKNNTGRVVLIALLLISLILNLFQWYNSNQEAGNYETTIDSMAIDNAEVDRQLSLTKAELEQYRGRSEQLDSLLNDATGKIAEQEDKIRALMSSGKKSSANNAALRRQLEELKALKDKYLEEIDRLIMENQRLQSENDSLAVELSNNVTVTNSLQARLKVAEQLRVDRVSVTPQKKRAIGGKAVATSMAKRTEKIDACFVVLENAVASRGTKLISLRLVAPDGKPLAGTSQGTFVNVDNGQEMTATANHQLDYDGSSMDLCLTWEDESKPLVPGKYGVEVYIDGALVFTSSFTLE
ncbi:MAG TPA: hypothetical protein DIW47_12560 [Bacteroidetes bacterium]|nr:hypothetical protein [Bacteroidota bacterium]